MQNHGSIFNRQSVCKRQNDMTLCDYLWRDRAHFIASVYPWPPKTLVTPLHFDLHHLEKQRSLQKYIWGNYVVPASRLDYTTGSRPSKYT